MNIIYCECVFVALDIRHEMCIRRVAIYGLVHSTIFSTVSHKQHGFRKNVIEHKMWV